MKEIVISIAVYITGRIIEGILKKKRKQKYVQIQKKYIEKTQKELQKNFEEEKLLTIIENIPVDSDPIPIVEIPPEENVIFFTQKKSWEEEILKYLQ